MILDKTENDPYLELVAAIVKQAYTDYARGLAAEVAMRHENRSKATKAYAEKVRRTATTNARQYWTEPTEAVVNRYMESIYKSRIRLGQRAKEFFTGGAEWLMTVASMEWVLRTARRRVLIWSLTGQTYLPQENRKLLHRRKVEEQ